VLQTSGGFPRPQARAGGGDEIRSSVVREDPHDNPHQLDPDLRRLTGNLDLCTRVVAHPNAHGHHEWQVTAYDAHGQRSHVLASRRSEEEARGALTRLAGLFEPSPALADQKDA
jgi:hypothetical protein